MDVAVAVGAAVLATAALALRARAPPPPPADAPGVVRQRSDLPPVTHDIMLRAARRLPTPRAPVWAMRQAGRYLPEFRAARVVNDFFTAVRTPAIAAELTLQPLKRFAGLLDAVVIFSDILIIPQGMGMEVTMEPGRGPVLPAPLADAADGLARLTLRPDVRAAFGYLFDAIAAVRAAAPAIAAVPVIGFVGGPWTLFAYMVEGGGTAGKGPEKAKAALLRDPAASRALLAAIADTAAELLVEQWRAGASLLQVFESNAGDLAPGQFATHALPHLLAIARAVRARTPPVDEGGPPLIVFARNAHGALEALAESEYDVIGLDWGIDPAEAVRRVGGRKALQGNLDPSELFTGAAGIEAATAEMLARFGPRTALIANLGHGMLPSHDPEALRAYFAAVHEISGRLRGADAAGRWPGA